MLINRLSPSMVIDYCNCPKMFYYRYVAKIQLPTKQIHLAFGSGVHAGIEDLYEGRDPYEAFKKEFTINKLMDDEKELYDEYFKLGHEMIKNYKDIHPELNKLYNLQKGQSEIYFREHLINPLSGEKSTLPLAGRIDRLTDDGKIVEYKTSKNAWKQEDTAFKVQTLLYNLWYYTKYNKMADETLYIVLLKKYKSVGKGETTQVLSNHSTLDELASIFEELELLVEKIENRQFERPKGYHPKWCDCYRYEELLNV